MATHHRPAIQRGARAAGLDALLVKGGAAAAAVRVAWKPVGDMSSARRDHTATLLKGGDVLILGGDSDVVEVFRPGTGTFATVAHTNVGHGRSCTATRLLDGRVLIAGGSSAPTAAEVYDPASHACSTVGAMSIGRHAHTATRLPDGRVLIAGGQDSGATTCYSSAEIFDPQTGSFALVTNQLATRRSGHGASLLTDGRVLIAGGTEITSPGYGVALRSAEIFDPATGAFGSVQDMADAHTGLCWCQPQRLSGGRVLIVGDKAARGELFDPLTGRFTSTGPLKLPRGAMSAVTVAGRFVVLTGGNSDVAGVSVTTDKVEVYDAATNTFRLLPHMRSARQQHVTTVVANRIMAAGGCTLASAGDLRSAEVLVFDRVRQHH